MSGRTIIVSAVWFIVGCQSPSPARSAAIARPVAAGRLTDSVEYRRLCVVSSDSAVDVRRPCVLRDQSPTIRKP